MTELQGWTPSTGTASMPALAMPYRLLAGRRPRLHRQRRMSSLGLSRDRVEGGVASGATRSNEGLFAEDI